MKLKNLFGLGLALFTVFHAVPAFAKFEDSWVKYPVTYTIYIYNESDVISEFGPSVALAPGANDAEAIKAAIRDGSVPSIVARKIKNPVTSLTRLEFSSQSDGRNVRISLWPVLSPRDLTQLDVGLKEKFMEQSTFGKSVKRLFSRQDWRKNNAFFALQGLNDVSAAIRIPPFEENTEKFISIGDYANKYYVSYGEPYQSYPSSIEELMARISLALLYYKNDTDIFRAR